MRENEALPFLNQDISFDVFQIHHAWFSGYSERMSLCSEHSPVPGRTGADIICQIKKKINISP